MTLTTTQIIIGVLVLLCIAAFAVVVMRQRRSAQIKDRFGPEYDRALDRTGDPHKAEEILQARAKRVASFHLVPLAPQMRGEFVAAWRDVQALFVDHPAKAVGQADVLLGKVMETRGYPLTDFEQQAADLSVDHPEVVENYRAGHDIAMRHQRGDAGTEDLRQAMIHYRALFDDLVNEPDANHPPAGSTERVRH